MRTVTIKDEFIKLGQVLKLAGLVGSGVEAKEVITSGQVKVNGETEDRRGRKIYDGYEIEYNNETIVVKAPASEE